MKRIGEILRGEVFWKMDAIKGGWVKKHLTSIKNVLENGDSEATQKIKHENVSALLNHAIATVEFYGRFSKDSSLKDFPVVSKSTIRENFELFTSTAFTKAQQIAVVTSGSTGTPFKVLHNEAKKSRNSADTIYFAGLAGFSVGSRLMYLKVWSANNRKSALLQWMQNIVPVDVISFNDIAISAMIKSIEKSNTTVGFLGYSSALELVCRYLDKNQQGKTKVNVSSALSMSESLTDYTKTTFHKYFGVEVLSRYSNVENGILAQQLPGSGNRYLVNTASYVLEILKIDSDEATAIGEPGRIVVTDLYNFAMPMIRYDTGDVGVLSGQSDQYGNLYLETIEGRKLDLLYATDGSLVSSYIVYKNMWQYTEISQYQLIQHRPKAYLFKINIDGAFYREQQLVAEFKRYLGQDADFTIEYVDEIPLLASGKRKKIVNTWHNQG